MAWPYIFEENFERGTLGKFDSETDTGSLLNFRHFSFLAREDTTVVGAIAPWRGAYCVELNLGDTNDHTLIEGDIDVVTADSGFTRFYMFLGKDLRATADDVFSIYELQGTANAQESVIAMRIIAATGAVQLASAQTQADAVTNAVWGDTLPRGRWLCIELVSAVVTGAATGTSQIFVDGAAYNTAVTNAAVNTTVARGVLGSQDTLSTTLGHIYLDCFVFDSSTTAANSARVYPNTDRYPETLFLSQSSHICLGYSDLLNVTLLPGAEAGNTLKIFDTDVANTNDDSNVVAQLFNLTISEPPIDLADVPVSVKRGAYVQLLLASGAEPVVGDTNKGPRALVHIGKSQGYYSHGRIRQHGTVRKPHNLATQ
jgi:hypothetical protein